jgi:hypothetical protein
MRFAQKKVMPSLLCRTICKKEKKSFALADKRSQRRQNTQSLPNKQNALVWETRSKCCIQFRMATPIGMPCTKSLAVKTRSALLINALAQATPNARANRASQTAAVKAELSPKAAPLALSMTAAAMPVWTDSTSQLAGVK